MLNRITLAFIALLFLSACATNVSEKQPLPNELLQVENISVEGDLRNVTQFHISTLEDAVRQELATRNVAGKSVDLKLIITRAEFITQGKRALIGAIAGANHLDVTIYLIKLNSNKKVGEFSVKVENNPGGFGVFSNPVESASKDAAVAIIDKIFAAR